MPKLKTNKAIKKRFKVTATGKVMAPASMRRHLMTDRSSRKKRQSRRWRSVHKSDLGRLKSALAQIR